jgi:hypothetical protein
MKKTIILFLLCCGILGMLHAQSPKVERVLRILKDYVPDR